MIERTIRFAMIGLMLALAGCASQSIGQRRLARYRPETGNRNPARWNELVAKRAVEVQQENNDSGKGLFSRVLRPGDAIIIYLRGIPDPEEIPDVIDGLGNVNLPLIGTVRLAGKTSAEAERTIARAYVDDGYYKKINIIVWSQDEYFVRGEVKKVGRYPLAGEITLLKAIAAAGGYTDYAKLSKIKLIRGVEMLFFDAGRIEARKMPDPVLKPGDIIIVPRRIFL